MSQTIQVSRAVLVCLALFAVWSPRDASAQDAVVARLHQHLGDMPPPIVLVVDSSHFPPAFWNRVKNLVAFRIHRDGPNGETLVDAAIYLVRDSKLFHKAEATLRNRVTNQEHVWCQLAAVIAHESAHSAPLTEHQALIAELAQLRRCVSAGHLFFSNDWDLPAYLMKVEAKLRNPPARH